MAMGTIDKGVLTDIANAIRVQNGGHRHLPALRDGGGGAGARRHQGGGALPGASDVRYRGDL